MRDVIQSADIGHQIPPRRQLAPSERFLSTLSMRATPGKSPGRRSPWNHPMPPVCDC